MHPSRNKEYNSHYKRLYRLKKKMSNENENHPGSDAATDILNFDDY
jgi:hypothetical protein